MHSFQWQYWPKWHLSYSKLTDPFGPTIYVLSIMPIRLTPTSPRD